MSKNFADSYSPDDFQSIERLEPTLDTDWEHSRPHREFLTSMIAGATDTDRPTLCVLGAGRCFDIDLGGLLQRFARVELVDIDRELVLDGVSQQHVNDSAVAVAESIDLTGVRKQLIEFRRHPSQHFLDAIFLDAQEFLPEQSGTHDVVASMCLLSSLLSFTIECVGIGNPRIIEVLRAIRLRHIEVMLHLLKPGGTGLLISDFVSTDSLPELSTTTDLSKTIEKAFETRNYYHGLNPAMVWQVFENEPLKNRVGKLKRSNLWRWYTEDKTFACFAISFEKMT